MASISTGSDANIVLRRNIFLAILVAVFLVFTGRLIQLQIVQGSQYRLQADAQGIKRMTIQPVRGALYDRNGYIIVASEGSHTVYVTPNKIDDESKEVLARILRTDTAEINSLIRKYKINPFTPIRIFRDVNDTAWAQLNEYYHLLAGVELENESKRYYEEEVRASHILGYVKEINRDEMERNDYYVPGDMVGKSGIEKEFEDFLRGEKGYEFVAVNNRGQRIESFNDGKSDQPPSNGFDLYLGLDAELQAYAEYLMKQSNYTGAVVAMDPSTGEILAMASAPDFDLDIFNGVTSPEEYRTLSGNPDKPLMNRATQAIYPPGSTWKPLMAIAALEEGLITPTSTISCPGSFTYGGRSWACHGGHGAVNVRRAIQASCNVFFYKLGLQMGIDTYHKWGEIFHFGERLRVDVPEGSTRLPSRAYYDENFGVDKWPRGVLVNLGIGQGELAVNPLQLAAYTAAIANNGVWNRPHFVSKVKNKRLGTIEDVAFDSEDLGLNLEYLKVVQNGMYDVVNVPGGTAGHVKIPGIEVAGKTGTAQNPHGKDHSWFISYAPFNNPKIAMCVLVENSGFGGTHAAPLSRKLIKFYFTREAEDGFVPFLEREHPPARTDIAPKLALNNEN